MPTAPSYAPLRELLRPYILRRMKSDPRVIADLPDKTEVNAYCGLVPDQAALYQRAVRDLAARFLATGSFLGIALIIAGAALFVRYSLARYLRFWLVRLVYESRANTDRIVEAIDRAAHGPE